MQGAPRADSSCLTYSNPISGAKNNVTQNNERKITIPLNWSVRTAVPKPMYRNVLSTKKISCTFSSVLFSCPYSALGNVSFAATSPVGFVGEQRILYDWLIAAFSNISVTIVTRMLQRSTSCPEKISRCASVDWITHLMAKSIASVALCVRSYPRSFEKTAEYL